MTRYSLVLFAGLSMAVGCGQSSSPSAPTTSPTPNTPPSPNGSGYSTNFPLTENPLSEGGNWIDGLAVGLDWSDVQTTSGFAFGTQKAAGRTGVQDSTAILTGTWTQNQTAQATVVVNVNGAHKEIELRLNSTMTAHSSTGYELSFETVGTITIIRWNGAFDDFTVIATGQNLPTGALKTGDVLYATNVNGLITAYVNGVQVNQCTDTTYTGGSPGIGLDFGDLATGSDSDFGFSSFTATD